MRKTLKRSKLDENSSMNFEELLLTPKQEKSFRKQGILSEVKNSSLLGISGSIAIDTGLLIDFFTSGSSTEIVSKQIINNEGRFGTFQKKLHLQSYYSFAACFDTLSPDPSADYYIGIVILIELKLAQSAKIQNAIM
ncbi:MAG: hypothetical protein ACFFCQ_03065 [Promethearchaeota archaeon]